MKIVGIEEHFLTNSVRNAWSVGEQDSSQGLNVGEVEKRLDDLSDGRIRLMDESGVDVQVLSLTSPGLHNLGSVKSVDLARQTNDLVSATVALRPDRFEGFATLPTAAPRETARELDRSIRHLGLKGAMLCGRTREKNLDHSDFLPIFEAAESLHVPLFIHPQIPQRAVQDAYYSGFGSQVDLAFAHLWSRVALRERDSISTVGFGWRI